MHNQANASHRVPPGGLAAPFAPCTPTTRVHNSPPVSVEHYENFPVASWLCPSELRPAARAIYWFARTADDIADEGDALPEVRRAMLNDYRGDLMKAAAGSAVSARWKGVF